MRSLPDALASRQGDDRPGYTHLGRTVSWSQVASESATRAEILSNFLPPTRPRRIGILLKDPSEYLFWVAGAILSGSCVVGFDPDNLKTLLSANATPAGSPVIVSDGTGLESLAHLGLDASHTIDLKGDRFLTMTDDVSDISPLDSTAQDDRPLFSFREGVSTNDSSTIDVSAKQATAAARQVVMATELTLHDICYDPLSLRHENSMLACWAPAVMAGSEIVLPGNFTPAQFLDDVQEFNCTFFTFAGTMIADVLDLPRTGSDSDHRLRVGFGTDSTPAQRQEFADRFACPIIDAQQWHSTVLLGS